MITRLPTGAATAIATVAVLESPLGPAVLFSFALLKVAVDDDVGSSAREGVAVLRVVVANVVRRLIPVPDSDDCEAEGIIREDADAVAVVDDTEVPVGDIRDEIDSRRELVAEVASTVGLGVDCETPGVILVPVAANVAAVVSEFVEVMSPEEFAVGDNV